MTETRENLVYMANQIARFFQSQTHETATLGVADHIGAFWGPRMRHALYARLDADDAPDLTPLARAGLQHLRGRDPAAVGRKLEDEGGVSFTQERGSDAG